MEFKNNQGKTLDRHNPFTPAEQPTPVQKMLVVLQTILAIAGIAWCAYYFFLPEKGWFAQLTDKIHIEDGGLLWVFVGVVVFVVFFHWFNTTLAKWLPKLVFNVFALLGLYAIYQVFFA